jgi:3-oxoadipate enol-lactonase
MAKSFTTGFADVNGTRLYYEVAGAGHPLVLNHAGVADSRMWDLQFGVFSQHYKVIRWDSRGYGRSAMPSGPYSGRGDLYALLRYLRVEKAHVLGLSMGGLAAIDFALEHPDMVTALIPVASALGGYQPPASPIWTEVQAALKQGDIARAAELQVRRWVDGPNRRPDQVDPGVRDKVLQMTTNAYSSTTEQGNHLPLDPPAIGRLKEIKAPTLVMVGDQDEPYMSDIAERLATGIQGAKKLVISGVAHMLNMEQPDEFNRVVLDFLASVGSAPMDRN